MIGIVIGALEGIMIFFVPEEPHKVGVFLGATLKGLINGLLVGLSVSTGSAWWQSAAVGLFYGFVLSLLIILPEGGFSSRDAKYIVPFSVLGGGLIGLIAVFV